MKISKTQLALGITALTVVSTLGISSVTLAAERLHVNKNVNTTSVTEHFGRGNRTLTDAQKTAMETKKTAIEAALKANDYNAWVTAVGVNAPILQKINTANFNSYIQLHNLRQQEDVLITQLGLNGNGEHGLGMGKGLGLNR
jgi:hypothetical protein